MTCRLSPVIVLLLPILVQSIDVDRVISSVRSIAVKHKQLPRQLVATGLYPYVVAAKELSRECFYDGSVCRVNPYVTVAQSAPRAESEVGKFAANIGGKSYLCGSHKTSKECVADTVNKCDVYDLEYSSTNDTMIETCDVSLVELTKIGTDFGLCPNSLADQFMTCLGWKGALATSGSDPLDFSQLLEPSSSQTCTSRDGYKCELLQSGGSSVCLSTEIKKHYDLTSDAGASAMMNDMLNPASTKFYGCCPGGKLLAQEVKCQDQKTKLACTAVSTCSWEVIEQSDGFTGTAAGFDGYCTMSTSAYLEMVYDVDTPFGRYMDAASSKCKALTADACDKTPKIAGLNMTKATENAKLEVRGGGGGACNNANSAHASSHYGQQLSFGLAFILVALFAAVQWT